MSRIPWTRYSGEDIEQVIAIMLCTRNPRATLVRPASGDGGLDVIVPTDEDGLYDVYQVKKFAENLKSSQKAQIKRSLIKVHETHLAGEIRVRNWYLTMPLDPTKPNLTWFKTITTDVPFNCEWRGLTFVESLAAAHSHVIDYYLRDGRDRLESTVRSLGLLKDTQNATGSTGEAVVGIDDLRDVLTAIQSMADTDPHFRYAIHLWPIEPPERTNDDAIFTASWHQPELDRWVTVGIYPRFAEALNFRPVTMNVVFTMPPDTPERMEFDRWRMYGRPFTAPPGTVEMTADLPFGLGWSTPQGGELKLSGEQVTDETKIRLTVAPSENGPQSSVTLNVIERAKAADGQGLWLRGTDAAEVLTFEMTYRLDSEEGIHFTFAPLPLTDKDPSLARPALRFIAEMHRATHMAIGTAYGPLPKKLGRLTETLGSDAPQPDHDLIADFAEALTRIQEHVPVRLLLPDLTEVSRSVAADYIRTGKLLAGEVVEATHAIRVCGVSGAPTPQSRTAAASAELSVTWAEQDYPVGTLYVHGSDVTASSGGDHDGHPDWLFTPSADHPWLFALDPDLLPVAPDQRPDSWKR